MSCDGVQALNPICRVGQAAVGGAAAVADSAFSHIAGFFGAAALSTTSWLWDQIDSATSLDLGSPDLAKELAATAAIAAVLCMGLFLIQIITATLRREPGGLGRAVRGLLISFLGSAFALASAKLLIAATDGLSASVVSYTMGTNIRGVGDKLALAKLVSIQNPAMVLIFAIVILCASVMVWAAMMTREMMILIAAVLAPLAFSGATADITRNWVRRWIEFVAAMIASKLLLVIILSVGVSVLNGAGQAGSGPTQVFTQLSAGSLILLMGGFAPWVAIRMFHFTGDTLYSAHATAAQGSAGARAVVSAPRKVSSAQWQARSLTSSMWALGLGRRSDRARAGTTPPTAEHQRHFGSGNHRSVGGLQCPAHCRRRRWKHCRSRCGRRRGCSRCGHSRCRWCCCRWCRCWPSVAAVAAPVVAGVGTVKAASAAQAATTGAALNAAAETSSGPKPTSAPKPPRAPRPPSANP